MASEATDYFTELPQKGDVVADGKYRIDRLIGQGGMGAVFVGVHTTLGSQVAIKWMLPKFASDQTAVQRFLREATIAAKIRHPNVVQPIDVSDDSSKPYIIMELLEGQNLAKYIGEGPLPFIELGRIFIPILEAVNAAHQHNIIHRDLKLDNIFLTDAGSGGIIPKVLDFGIAKITDKATFATITQDHSVLGTVQYMSPEQITRPSEVGAQTDVYALGVILYRLLSGTFPHQADNILDLALRIRDTPPTPLSRHLPNLPKGLEDAINKAIASSMAERFPDVTSFRDAIVPYFSQNQKWMDSCRSDKVAGPDREIQTLTADVRKPIPATDYSIPSSLHSIELDGYPDRRKKKFFLWVSLVVVVLALMGTFAWIRFTKSNMTTLTERPQIDRKRIDEGKKRSINSMPQPPKALVQPKPNVAARNEWPSLSDTNGAGEPKGKENEPTIRSNIHESVPKSSVPKTPASVPTQFKTPNNHRIIYKRYSGSRPAKKEFQTTPNRAEQTLRGSSFKRTESPPKSIRVEKRTDELNLDDF